MLSRHDAGYELDKPIAEAIWRYGGDLRSGASLDIVMPEMNLMNLSNLAGRSGQLARTSCHLSDDRCRNAGLGGIVTGRALQVSSWGGSHIFRIVSVQ